MYIADDVECVTAASEANEQKGDWKFKTADWRWTRTGTHADILGDRFQVVGKGDKFAVLPINGRLRRELERFGSLGDGLKIDKQKSIREIKKVCTKLKIAAASGCPVAVAMRLLRHSSSAMTLDVYTHIVPADMREWAEKV